MGAGGSLPTNARSIEPPPLPPPFVTGNNHHHRHHYHHQSENSRISGTSEESQERTASRASTVTLGNPPSQGPSPYATLRREEWWHHRPSAPSLPNLHPQPETLLTYAAQMTGWQTGGGGADPPVAQQEALELSRTVSHLAAANQQLASAHNTALTHLEALYIELRREKESRREYGDRESRKKLEDEGEEDDERREMRLHIARLEALLAERSSFFQTQQSLQREDERKLRERAERLECELVSRSEEIRTIRNKIREANEKEDDKSEASNVESVEDEEIRSTERFSGAKRGFRSSPTTETNFVLERRTESDDFERALTKIETLEKQLTIERSKNTRERVKDDLNREYQKAVRRIRALEEELELRRIDSSSETKCDAAVDRTVELEATLRPEARRNDDAGARGANVEAMRNEETSELLREIERLRIDRSESQIVNAKLRKDLESQRKTIEELRENYEISRAQCQKIESHLTDRGDRLKDLRRDLDSAREETTKLRKELDAFHLEKDTAEARISNLEQDLQKSALEKEQIRNAESQKSSKLRARLSEEVTDKKKQIKALEDALMEIQRLKEVLKTEKKEEAGASFAESPLASSNLVGTFDAIEEVPEEASSSRTANMEEFKKELTLKREARQRAIAAVSSEMDRLRRELDAEKEAHSETSKVLELLKSGQAKPKADVTVDSAIPDIVAADETLKMELKLERQSHEETLRRVEAQRLADTLKISDELKNDIRHQTEKLDDLRSQLNSDNENHRRRISSLKEMADANRKVVGVRERQVNKLKDLLAQILARLGDRSFLEISDDVREEYDHQLDNIRSLKSLYEERLRVMIELKDAALKELADTKEKLEILQKKEGNMAEELKKAEETIDTQDTEISNLESQLGLTKADCRDLQNQMSVINGLFTQMLLGASSADMDLDRLTRLLQENHDLISDMAREEGTEAAALPKLLLDLVEQVEGRGRAESSGNDTEKKEEDLHEEKNIAHNLPKVWRVLLELLSCHAVDAPTVSASSSSAPDSCYKSVDTPTGPRLVISVSKTYIRLKELILEKKSLEKEMNRMKQLNTHLESKLGEQEKRLSTVSDELSKTWNIVGRMQAQHQQLHTHEKILRYELQQKRKMLQELKQELEYCREKWESARQKNTNTELEWRSLRREFAARKALTEHDSFNNSGESGFSDERGDDSDEEDETVEERVRISPRRRARKESPRIPSPDTESEQPTDTELSESKTGSSGTLEQRTPTPETEGEVDSEIIEMDAVTKLRPATPEPDRTPDTEPLDPLDRALTNVIEKLIKIDDTSNPGTASTSRESIPMPLASCSFRDPGLTVRAKSGSPKRRSAKRNAREWSPRSEPWSSWTNEFDRSWTLPKGNDANVEASSTRSADGAPTLECDSFDVTSQPIPNDPDDIGEPSTSAASAMETRTDSENDRTTRAVEGENDFPRVHEEPPVSTMSLFSIGPFPTSVESPLPVKSVQFSDPLIVGPSNVLFAPVFGEALVMEESMVARDSDDSREDAEEPTTSTDYGCNVIEERLSRLSETRNVDGDDTSIESSSSVETVREYQTINRANEEAEPSPLTVSVDVSASLPPPPKPESIRVVPSIEPLDVPSASTDRNDETTGRNEQTTVDPRQTSPPASTVAPVRSHEEVLAARAARLKRLEEQADWLMKKMNATSQRGSALSTRLEELHEVYGEAPAPPPLPDVLPNMRLETDMNREVPAAPPMPAVLPTRRLPTEKSANESPPNGAP